MRVTAANIDYIKPFSWFGFHYTRSLKDRSGLKNFKVGNSYEESYPWRASRAILGATCASVQAADLAR